MITWNKDTYNKAKSTDESIVKAKAKIWKKPLKDDPDYNDYFVINTLSKYTLRPVSIVYWNLKDKILFKFYGNTTWNEFEKNSNKVLHDYLADIGKEILKEFPNTYNGVKFMSYIESQRYWAYNHIIDFEI